jgi:hypothetical protein
MVDDLRGRVTRAILLGGLAAGTCDILDPIIFWGIRVGATPINILHSVASGWIGREAAIQGGMATALLGLVTHFFIATSWSAIFVLASLKLPALRRKPLVIGPIYGLLVYAAMYYVVLPYLSKALTRPSAVPIILINNLGIHMIVGTAIAFVASRVLGSAPTPAVRATPHPARG